MTKLKPCPFCGEHGQIRTIKDAIKGKSYQPRCIKTSCLGRSAKKFPSLEAAEKAWNKRAGE